MICFSFHFSFRSCSVLGLWVEVWSTQLLSSWCETILILGKWGQISHIIVIAGDWVTVNWIHALDHWSELSFELDIVWVLLVGLQSDNVVVGVCHVVIVVAWVDVRGDSASVASGN